jgi:hypothetical protein
MFSNPHWSNPFFKTSKVLLAHMALRRPHRLVAVVMGRAGIFIGFCDALITGMP